MIAPHPIHLRALALAVLAVFAGIPAVPSAATGSAQERIIAGYADQSKTAGDWTGSFSSERGRAFFLARPGTGKPETPSCTACHSESPSNQGRTRAGKEIAPLALSKTPDRFSDPKKVEKWFRRNCRSVLNRLCSPREKGDFLTFMIGQ